MNDHPPLETERLRLVPLDPRHAEALHRVFANPEAMRFWVEPPHRNVEQTAKMIARMVGGAEHVWSIVPKDDSDPIGIIYYLGNPEPPGMGYIQHPASWGKGLMSEAVQATLAHGFGPMGFDRVELWIDERNKRSRSLATRNGFVRQGRFQMRYAHDKQPHIKLTYGLLACTWRGEPEPGAVLERVETILPVANVRRAALWYRNRLGFRISFLYGEPPTHGAVTLSPWTASGSTIQLTQAEAPAPGVALFFHVSGDIDALHSEIAARGVTIERPLQRTAWGQREFAVRDLDGYLIRFGSGG